MHRRAFLQQSLGAPALIAKWKMGPPRPYFQELTTLMRAAPVPGAVVGAVAGHKPAWIAPLGVRAPGSSAVTASTLFQAASLTKQFTAYAVLALRERGKLDLDRPVVEYVDGLPNPEARKVTARHILSHSSGFPNWRFAEASKPLPELAPAFPPGTKFQYSGEGFFYLQRVLERISGTGFGQVLRDVVFDPLDMKSSTVVWDPATLDRTALPHGRHGEARPNWEKSARAARAFAERAGKPVERLTYEDYSQVPREAGDPALPNWMQPNAASSLITSAEDYTRFLIAAMRNPEIGKQQVTINEFLGWGLGWGIERMNGRSWLWQWGDNGGYKNFVLAEPATGDALFVFTNGDSGARIYDRVLTHATGCDHPALFWV